MSDIKETPTIQNLETPVKCLVCKLFFGNKEHNDLCSKCYKDWLST